MNDFCLANSVSINLNFLIYIHNLYKCQNEQTSSPSIFPWLPLEKDSFIDDKELDIRLKELWSAIFNSDDLYRKDIEHWINGKFLFHELFKSDSLGIKTYQVVKKSFEHWYWGTGYKMCGKFSDCLVEEYYKGLITSAQEKDLRLKGIRFYLQVVYDIPSIGLELKNENSIIISPQFELPTIEDVLYLCLIC